MSAPLARDRAILIMVPLALTIAACQPARCTAAQLEAVTPCQGEDAGSMCTPEDNSVVEWDPRFPGAAEYVDAPALTWTYPCSADGYEVQLMDWASSTTSGISHSSTGSSYNPPELHGPRWSWTPTMPLWEPAHRYGYTVRAWLQGDTSYPGDRVWSEKGIVVFYTGPFCEDPLAPPQLVWPPDGVGFREEEQSQEGFAPVSYTWIGEGCCSTGGPLPCIPGSDCFPHLEHSGFSWAYASCLSPSEGQVATDDTFTTGVMSILTSSPLDVSDGSVGGPVEWCHTYYWRVRASSGEDAGGWSDVFSFQIAPPGGWQECFAFSPQDAAIEAVVTQNASCRVGPSTTYGIWTYVPAGERHPVDGRNVDGTWWRLADIGCYINRNLVSAVVQGTPFPGGADASSLMTLIPEVPDPPTPAAPTAACKATLGSGECAAAGGTWLCATKCGLACTEVCSCDCP